MLEAGNSIIMRKMKGVHERTISCYSNPSQLLVMLIIMFFRNNLAEMFIIIRNKFALADYLLFGLFGFCTSNSQTLRFLAIQYDEPKNLMPYTYLTSVY